MPNTFAWEVSIHPYIHTVNGNGDSFYLCVRPLSSQPIFIMALRTGYNDWQELLTKIRIPADSARTYAKIFAEESIIKDSLTMKDWEVLKELGVTTMGHALAILNIRQLYEGPCSLNFPSSIQRWHHNNSESLESTGRYLCEWQTCPLHRPTSSYTTVPMRLSKHQL